MQGNIPITSDKQPKPKAIKYVQVLYRIPRPRLAIRSTANQARKKAFTGKDG